MLAWIISRSTVISNIRSLPTAQLLLPYTHYSLHSVHKLHAACLSLKLRCSGCFFLLSVIHRSSCQSFLKVSDFQQKSVTACFCSLAFGRFKPAIYCSFLVLRCLQSTARISLFDSCFRILILISHTLLLAAQCFPYALLVISWMLLTGHILLTALFYFAVCWY